MLAQSLVKPLVFSLVRHLIASGTDTITLINPFTTVDVTCHFTTVDSTQYFQQL